MFLNFKKCNQHVQQIFITDFDALPFLKWCQEVHKVTAIPGARFSNHGESKNYIRVSIAFHSADTIAKAAETLCNAVTEYMKEKATGADLTLGRPRL